MKKFDEKGFLKDFKELCRKYGFDYVEESMNIDIEKVDVDTHSKYYYGYNGVCIRESPNVNINFKLLRYRHELVKDGTPLISGPNVDERIIEREEKYAKSFSEQMFENDIKNGFI